MTKTRTVLPWRAVIDGWVRDASIRRDTLIGLALALTALVLVTSITTAVVVGAVATYLGTRAATAAAQKRRG